MRDAYLNAYLYFPSEEGVLLADGTVETRPMDNSVKTYTTVYEGASPDIKRYAVKVDSLMMGTDCLLAGHAFCVTVLALVKNMCMDSLSL